MASWLTAANLFTLLRLALVPFVVLAILQGHHVQALVLFIAAGFTDVVDGALARNFGQVSQVGAYLDPLADKCLLSGIFLAFGSSGMVPWWFVGLIFGRDLYILIGVLAFLSLTKVRKFPPSVWGKASTFVQISTAVVWLARNILNIPVMDALSSAMLWVCAVFTAWSGLHYTLRAVQLLRAD